MKFEVLLNILDQIRGEASAKNFNRYNPSVDDIEKVNNARSRAFIHLYLKVSFGLLNFDEREHLITDGTYDGGIDGYYINGETRTIYLIQSKFRTKAHNFESKKIELEEILVMDVNRILTGEEFDEVGNLYNGKIKQLQREVSLLSDVGRYTYKIVLLANLNEVSPSKLSQLTGGFLVEVFNFEKSYEKLVFPVLSGTYFNESDLRIPIDLSNKNAGSKISYNVKTKICECEITVLFVPTIEIAKIMYKYKNSILKYNPRSYLELDGQNVNSAIRETILETDTNEFALYNNGITMLSDETYINEKIGQKNKAQLTVKNPQIINGGQTSYTLSRIYNEHKEMPEKIFAAKEVLLKVITLIDNNSHEDKLSLIKEISNATNQQSPVINADKFANEKFHQKLQEKLFERFGLLYERKRGEFADGVHDKYVKSNMVVERNLLLRIYYCANGKINKGSQKKLFQKNEFSDIDIDNNYALDRFFIGYKVFNILIEKYKRHQKLQNIRLGKDFYGKIYASVEICFNGKMEVKEDELLQSMEKLKAEWESFLSHVAMSAYSKRRIFDRSTGEQRMVFSEARYYRTDAFERDLIDYFNVKRIAL